MNNLMKEVLKKLLCTVMLTVTIFSFLTNYHESYAAEANPKPYLIKVNRYYNTITIYESGENGKYDTPIKAMVCSVGLKRTQTTKGTFQTKEKYRWKALVGNVWGQYSTRIVGGILFHSVYYYRYGNPATLATAEYNKLGSSASHGCIRLTVEDAKWIYDNCDIGTTVVIYDDTKSPGPLGKPEAIKLPSSVRWDPTDPNKDNPYYNSLPSIKGVKNRSIEWGETLDLRKGLSAASCVGMNITSKVKISGDVNSYKPGKYKVTYSVQDALGRIAMQMITVKVNECKIKPVITGVTDRVVQGGTQIDEAYALIGVEAYCSDIKLKSSDIKVKIQEITDEKYKITYSVNLGKQAVTTKSAKIYIDNEPPVIEGVSDRILDEDQIVDEEFALEGVTVSDNYTNMDIDGIKVNIIENSDGSYDVIYQAVDDVGNKTKVKVKFYYDLSSPSDEE